MIRIAILALATAFSVSSFAAKSNAELAAEREVASLNFVIAASKKCDAVRAMRVPETMPVEVTKDAQGRPVTIRTAQGVDMVFDYTPDGKMSGVTTQGKRIDLLGALRDPETLGKLKARTFLFNKVKQLCGVQAEPPVDYFYECGGAECGSMIDPGWWGVDYWSNEWEPVYDSYVDWSQYQGPTPEPEPQCVNRCQLACDIAADVTMVGCGVAAYYALAMGPGASAAVGTACAAGSTVGKYVCKLVTCMNECR